MPSTLPLRWVPRTVKPHRRLFTTLTCDESAFNSALWRVIRVIDWQAVEKGLVEHKDIARSIKQEFDKKHGPTWHCVVGRHFGKQKSLRSIISCSHWNGSVRLSLSPSALGIPAVGDQHCHSLRACLDAGDHIMILQLFRCCKIRCAAIWVYSRFIVHRFICDAWG